MILQLIRFSPGEDDTLGILYVNGKFECFTLEDEYREIKVKHETRIPEGTYKIEFMKYDTPLTLKYRKRYSWFNKHLHITNIPNFTSVYIHIGNDDDDTSGCILVGNTATSNRDHEGYVANSTVTFKSLYKKISKALLKKEDVYIVITKIN